MVLYTDATTGLRVYKELACTRKDQLDLANKLVFIPDSKTPTGVAEVPLTDIAVEAFRNQLAISGTGPWLFPSPKSPTGYQREFKKAWERTLRAAGIPYFRLYDLRSTHATRLSAGGVADEWGNSDAPPERCQGVQEVLTNEAAVGSYRWRRHCRGLYQTPIAA
jgi:integrase